MKPWRVPFAKAGRGVGLQRVSAIAAKLGVDLAAFGATSAVITGTNGKGSTSAMSASILRQAAGLIGLFTSPHLFDLNERFQVDGRTISDDALQMHWDRALEATVASGEADNLGGFEFLFLIAADWFASQRCAAIIWEAGIGGRYDPTRLVAAQRTALTSLDYEHTHWLGDTLEEIAANKLDAAPAGARVFISESCLPQRASIQAHCASRELTPIFVAADPALSPSLPGAFQCANASIAARIAGDLRPELRGEQIAKGLAETIWPGRLEIIGRNPLVVIDVGHTPDAVAAALAGFRQMAGGRRALLVCGASQDKKTNDMIGALAPHFQVIVAAAARHKGAPAAQIAAQAAAANPAAEVIVAENVADAHAIARARTGPGDAIYVAGGLFLAVEFKAVDLGRDPASLAFF